LGEGGADAGEVDVGVGGLVDEVDEEVVGCGEFCGGQDVSTGG